MNRGHAAAEQKERPMTTTLDGARVAILAADGVDDDGMLALWRELERSRAIPVLVSPDTEPLRCYSGGLPVRRIEVDIRVALVEPFDLDALVIPSGLSSANALRSDVRSIILTRAIAEQRKPIIAIGHAGWLLAEAGLSEGLDAAGDPAIRLDLENAGAHWRGDSVVRDGLITTARGADDVPAAIRSLRDALTVASARRAAPLSLVD